MAGRNPNPTFALFLNPAAEAALVFSLTKLGGGSSHRPFSLACYPAAKLELASCGRIMPTIRQAAASARAAISTPSA
jgi:hypothetical protein